MASSAASGQRRSKSWGDLEKAEKRHVEVLDDWEESHKDAQDLSHVNTELEFAQWYHGIENELLDASHQEYQ